MADVFISYKSERRAAAQHLARILELNGFSVWFDYGLFSGKDFGPQIEREIRAAKAVVVLWCSLSRDSPWVIEEAHLSDKLGTFTPVWLERVDPPLGFARAHTIDLKEWDGGPRSHRLDGLLIEIGRRVGREPAPQFRGLQEYEQTWRSFGAPSLTRFALGAPVADCEAERLDGESRSGPAIPLAARAASATAVHAAAPPAPALERAPLLPLWRDALRYFVAPLLVLLVAHYITVNVYDLNTDYLWAASVLVPFAAGLTLALFGGRGGASAAAFAIALALAGASGMTVSESLYSGEPIMPQSRFEWLDNFQFAGTIALSYIFGHLAARMPRAMLSRKLGKP